MLNKLLDKYTKFLQRKGKRKFGGELLFYITMDKSKPPPNIYMHSIHPDLAEDAILCEMMKNVAERVRRFHEGKIGEDETTSNEYIDYEVQCINNMRTEPLTEKRKEELRNKYKMEDK